MGVVTIHSSQLAFGFVHKRTLGMKTVKCHVPFVNRAATAFGAPPTFTQVTQENRHDNDVVQFPPPLNKVGKFTRAATLWFGGFPIVVSYFSLIYHLRFQNMIGQSLKEEDEQVRDVAVVSIANIVKRTLRLTK